MNARFSPSNLVWACDTVWTRDAAADFEPGAVNVAGVMLITRYPLGHPLHEIPCGVLITRLAGQGYARHLWYN